ncbi:adenylate isopentenyltransferase 5, chloroplastic [Dendrobium catenatum]|uniref:adenylate dimethylallyltransferase (ADP/ATP-dependent) n=1 Tax=Dendrobium catenatum TaxID=906689 RepID=A0A2I0W3V0_9ASPA|nr:adenylate isopentenyltransferase 5, chloroplastic [Dendrobium catenatum]PKU70346.1 Adenylate isopentenyltransferase 3, chloroplastic [Dendrobium catenatum]
MNLCCSLPPSIHRHRNPSASMASLLCLKKTIILPTGPTGKFRRDQCVSDHSSDNHPPFPLLQLTPKTDKKAIFILGSSGTGKSKLAVTLALRFAGEIINSDKMQVYDDLHIITNKIKPEERFNVPHHLLGGVNPDSEFTAVDFRQKSAASVQEISARGHLPIVAGGSNSYIKEMVAGDNGLLDRGYQCCFIWVDADGKALEEFVSERVEKMVEEGLVEEARAMFKPEADYSKGVRKAIGLPEMESYFRRQGNADERERAAVLAEAIGAIKENTCRLTRRQREKIGRFEAEEGWQLNRVDATAALMRRREASAAEELWEKMVVEPSVDVVKKFVGEVGGQT